MTNNPRQGTPTTTIYIKELFMAVSSRYCSFDIRNRLARADNALFTTPETVQEWSVVGFRC